MKIAIPNYNYRAIITSAVIIICLVCIGSLLPEELTIRRWIAAFFASNALVGMALTFVLATRLEILESIFGGLDRVYKAHRWAGMWSVLSIFIHWLLVPQTEVKRSALSLTELGADSGEWATMLLLVLVTISFLRILPYHWWKWTHRLMGLVFVLSVFHFIFSLKPFGLFSAAGIAMSITSVIGIYAWWYYLKKKSKSKSHLAKIKSINRYDDAISFDVKPVQGELYWQAGQFAFISLLNHPKISSEAHPFTIASSSHSNLARFSVAVFGDYTRKLHQHLKEGDLVKLEMPYGRFKLNHNQREQIWIGTGIGMTPFLAWLHELVQDPTRCPKVKVYYLVKNKEKAIFENELKDLSSRLANVDLEIYYSEVEHLSAEAIGASLGETITNAELYFCGNPNARNSIQMGLEELGMPQNRIHYELFDFRGAV